MFLDFFQMRQQPFGVTPDTAFLYPSQNHRVALASLSSGIREGRGFMALIGPPGMGKTTLLYQLLEDFHGTACTAFLFQTLCDSREFFQYLLTELRIDSRGMDQVAMHAKLNEVLFAEMIAGRRFVLIIDEAQNLTDAVLETVRMLSNFETSHTKLIQIVLSGQPQLAEKLAQPNFLQLRQRIAVLGRLEPLSRPEVAAYIEHRLGVAGYAGAPLFDPEAVRLIAHHSQGIPRSVNNLCHNALSLACVRGERTVNLSVVMQVCEDLNFAWTPRPRLRIPEPTPFIFESVDPFFAETFPSEVAQPAAPDLEMPIEGIVVGDAAEPVFVGTTPVIGDVPSAELDSAEPIESIDQISVETPSELAAPAAEPLVEPLLEPVASEAAAEPAQEFLLASSGVEPSGEFAANLVPEPLAELMSEALAAQSEEPVAEPITESAPELLPEPVLVAAESGESVAEPALEPDLAAAEISEAVAAPVAEPVLVAPRIEIVPMFAAISYAPRKKFRLPRWGFHLTIVMSTLLGAGLIYEVAKFVQPSLARAASIAHQAAAAKAQSYSADPQVIGAAQVVTVAAMPQQTLKDIAILYIGYYNPQVLTEIQLLNPTITDPDHLQPGQLIRLPLPQGSFRQGDGISEEP